VVQAKQIAAVILPTLFWIVFIAVLVIVATSPQHAAAPVKGQLTPVAPIPAPTLADLAVHDALLWMLIIAIAILALRRR
jgi:hypothetical protein